MLKLASYEYTIIFRPTHKHGNADALSRLQIKDPEGKDELTNRVGPFDGSNRPDITAENIRIRTQSNQTLTRVYSYTQEDWPTNIPETLNCTVRDEQNCLH